MMKFSTLFSAVLLASSASALPALLKRQGQDPPFSLPAQTYQDSIVCPTGLNGQNSPGGVVLLVHGTASNGFESWANGPYVNLLPNDPNAGPKHDVCYINLPDRALGDAQISGEYVAYAIKYLSQQSATGQVATIGHSQGGGLNIQYALQYFPSTREEVSDYIALAGDFKGTDEGPPACLVLTATTGGCNPSIIQQIPNSAYLKAQNGGDGGRALVPTTSIYTIFDEIVQDQVVTPTSDLPGAEVIKLQDVCGVTYVQDHFGMIVDTASYGLALDALSHQGTANPARLNPAYCLRSYNTQGSTEQNFKNVPIVAKEAAADALAVITFPKVEKEPELKSYVCEANMMPSSQCAPPSPVGSMTFNQPQNKIRAKRLSSLRDRFGRVVKF